MSSFIWALTSSRLGRWVMGVLASALALLVFVASAFRAGKRAAESEQARASLENLRTRERIDDETAKTAADDRRRRLSRWVSDDR